MKTFEEAQKSIVEWIQYNFGYSPRDLWAFGRPPTEEEQRSELGVVGGLVEEVGELFRCVIKMDQGIRGSKEEWMYELMKEIGDVFIKLNDVCDYYGFDMEEVVNVRWEAVSKRNWREDSVGHGIAGE